MQTFDVVVIGAGTGGQTAALELAVEGLSVAVVEQSNTPGGICALHGCQPKKYFYEVAEIAAKSDHLEGLGITGLPRTSWSQISAAKNKLTAGVPENTVANLKGNNITYLKGTASFENRNRIWVGEEQLEAEFFIIATGAQPMQLPIEGSEHLLTSNEFLALEALPPRLVFVGGGFISFEFAHFAARLNNHTTETTILEVMERPLGPFDGDMVQQLVAASAHDGINVQCGVKISAIEKKGDGFVVRLDDGEPINADLVINGAGRVPALEALQLDKAGVGFSRKGIHVDKGMRSSVETIFAVGDCADTLQLARVADREALGAVNNILSAKGEGEQVQISYKEAPAVLFTYPQLAMVGKTEDQLKAEQIRYWKSTDTNLGWPTYRRIGLRHAAYKILVDENDLILGAHILSDNATGLINTFRMAMLHDIDIRKLRQDAILSPYPSRESDMLYMLDPLVQ
ncbi:MAG: dihydrolipoyl dehydrogenase family protein [Desulfocapsaceae bacterium]